MFLRIVCLAFVLATQSIWGPSFLQAQEKPSFKERWKLELLPDELPRGGELNDTFWVQTHAINILGEGTDYAISFPLPANDPQLYPSHEPRIHFTHINHMGFGGVPDFEVSVKHTLNVRGPFLEYGGQVRSFHVAKDDYFLLDAVIKVAPNKWYQLKSELIDEKGKRLLPEQVGRFQRRTMDVRIEEHLFEFEQDPLTVDQGQMTIHRNRRKLKDKSGDLLHLPTSFSVARKVPASSELQFRGVSHKSIHTEVSLPGTKLVFLDAAGSCAMAPDHASGPSGLFQPWPKPGPPARPKP